MKVGLIVSMAQLGSFGTMTERPDEHRNNRGIVQKCGSGNADSRQHQQPAELALRSPRTRPPTRSTTPVSRRPAVTINNAPTISSALLMNPEKAFWGT